MRQALKILSLSLIGLFLLLVLFVQYLISDYNSTYQAEEITQLQKEISASKKLPQTFVQIYFEHHPISNTTRALIDGFTGSKSSHCPCQQVATLRNPDLAKIDLGIKANRHVLAWKLEKEVSQEECLNYLAANLDFLFNTRGVEEASLFYFEQNLELLNEEQLKTLVLMMKNPSFYNPRINPDITEAKLNKLWSNS